MNQDEQSLLRQTPELVTPEELLDYDDYNNYRTIRVITVLFVIGSWIVVAAGVLWLIDFIIGGFRDFSSVAFALVGLLVGFAGITGGRSVLFGDRSQANLFYVAIICFLFGVPIGTVMGYIAIKGLPKYFDTMEKLAQVRSGKLAASEFYPVSQAD